MTQKYLARNLQEVPWFLRRLELIRIHHRVSLRSARTLLFIMTSKMQLRGRRRRRTQSRMNQALRNIRQQWKLLGFFEIDEQHEFYEFTCMLKEGLRASVQNAIDNPVKPENHGASEFTAVLKQSHEGFQMRTYAAPVFARFRRLLGMVDREYQTSLSSDKAYLQFISNSRSKADFFLTNDKRFFLKTQSKREIRFLLLNLGKYLEHVERYPHSILVRFLGIHSILVPQEKKKYFIIMQSVFYPHERIIERYDIKGCEVNRWTDPAPEGSEVIVVLKDRNFGEKSICLGHECGWLVHQVELDTEFLKDLHVLDYSLLVGLQPLHPDERILNEALANIIARATVSLRESSVHNMHSSYWDSEDAGCFSSVTQASSLDHMYKLSLESRSAIKKALSVYLKKRPETEKALGESTKSEIFLREVMAPYLMQVSNVDQLADAASEVSSITSSTEGSSELQGLNRRLLPNTRNPLHTIDGPEYRYFVGIIDLFTVYGFRKKLEYFWKSIRYRGQSFSTVHPVCYARRFCQWVEDHTT